ncbi:uncharacterized protein LOC126409836 [Nymphaea colorata]|uniref:uncharacterized protein LOC126409836 n=1 Tax=Nymphaea colorata TaxID=210225 RepID=UPI00214E6D79|nr:uncharacterized protein LOC126409836 [Nymphaea colorata]
MAERRHDVVAPWYQNKCNLTKQEPFYSSQHYIYCCSEVGGRDSNPLPLVENALGPPAAPRQLWTGKDSPAPSREVTMKDREMEAPLNLQSETYSAGGRKQRLPSTEGLVIEEHSKTSLQSPLKRGAPIVGNSINRISPSWGPRDTGGEWRKFLFIPDEVYEEMTKPFRFAAIGAFYGGGSKASMEHSFVFKNLRHQ